MDTVINWRTPVAAIVALAVCCAAVDSRAQDPASPDPETPPPDPAAEPATAEPPPSPEQTPQAPIAYPGLGTPTVKAPDPRDDMDLAFDLGVGFLEFIHLDITWLISREWSVGLGAGFFPIDWALRKLMKVDDLSAAAQFHNLELAGDVETALGSGRLFGRWYPWKKRFFTELSVEVWRMMVTATGTLTNVEEDLEDQLLEIKTTAKVWVPMVGLHAGWRFLWKNGAYLDLAGGVNLLLSPGAEVTLGGATIEQLQEYPEIAAMLEEAQTFLTDELKAGANRITKKIKVFPTAALRFGWAFDFW
jgi:hypothetical protein